MESWIKYASQLNYVNKAYGYRKEKIEIFQNTLISNSFFDDIGNSGAVLLSNYSASLIVDSSVFLKCRNSKHGAAIKAEIVGSSSFCLSKSCIDSCKAIDSAYSSSFCVSGSTKYHLVRCEQCTITNNEGNSNDGISVWSSRSTLEFLNISGCRAKNQFAALSTSSGNSCSQQYNEYSNLSSIGIIKHANICDSIFRCIFRDCDAQTSNFFLVQGSYLLITSCVFKSCGSSLFTLNLNPIINCFDCNFDISVKNQSSISYFSNNAEFQQIFTYRSFEKCTFSNHYNVSCGKTGILPVTNILMLIDLLSVNKNDL